jgi:3-hydroxypropanoate dehydrogenase
MHMTSVDESVLKLLFICARAQNGWKAELVSNSQLREAYDIAKWGPTSMNCQPIRIVFLRSEESKARLKPALAPGNVEKTMTAPVVAIIAYDVNFPEHLPRVFPHNQSARNIFVGNEELTEATAFRNGTLQGGYFILSLRAIGLDVAPMSGFNSVLVDNTFFLGTTYKTNFLCGIGLGDPDKQFRRSPRLEFDEVAEIL